MSYESKEGRRRLRLRVLLGVLPFVGVALAWAVLAHGFSVRQVFLPPPEQMPPVIWGMFAREGILGDILISCYRVMAGFVAAMLVATPLGVLMGHNLRVRQFFEPIIGFIRYMPVPVFIPLCILWFGSDDLEKVIIIFLGAFFQLTLMIQDAAYSVRRDFYEAAVMLGAPRRDLVYRVLWPAALPQIFDSYRVCLGWAWTYLIVAEIVGARTGIGFYIIKAQRYLMVPQIFAAMTLIGVLGMTTDLVLGASHRRLFGWAQESDS
ncbi:MAG: ABC transporter permease [Acidobacteriota bacterium]|nr:ABC transporter permease [Acidobacteriota bacterium]MDQ5835250.1 ABC transporter permease [Acidobacteriota bacterium]